MLIGEEKYQNLVLQCRRDGDKEIVDFNKEKKRVILPIGLGFKSYAV